MASHSLPPGPRGMPVLGSLPSFYNHTIDFLFRLSTEYGDVASFRFPPNRTEVFLRHPDHIKDVLADRSRLFAKSNYYEMLKLIVGEGLVTSEGEFHKRQRRLAQPAFHKSRIAVYASVMTEYAARTRERWRGGKVIDIAHEMMRLTLAIVARTLFNADVETDARHVGAAVTDLISIVHNPIALLAPRLFVRLPIPRARLYRRQRRVLDATINRIIEERRTTGEDTGDLLSMLLLARDEEAADPSGMSNQQLRDEVMTIFLAGHETTANALTWAWCMLSEHPRIEDRLYAELDEQLGGRMPTFGDFPRLAYTQMIFTETLRRFPPAWIILRRALSDCEIGGFEIPAGTDIFLSPYVTQHDARFFPEPLTFEPDRWAAAANGRPEYSYFPFGGGPRLCIGESFAKMEGVLILATLAQRWRLRLVAPDEVQPQSLVTLRPPETGIHVRLERR